MLDNEKIREWYAALSKKISNYHQYLPEAPSDLANEILKDPYDYDFLTMQAGLVAHIRDFLLELGQGFAFLSFKLVFHSN